LLSAAYVGGSGGREGGHFHSSQSLGYALFDLRFGASGDLQPVRDVLKNGEMGKERIVLEDSVDAAFVGRHCVEPLARHPNLSEISAFKTGNDAQKRSFARAAFSQDREKLARRYVE